jgi:hypothetical protein
MIELLRGKTIKDVRRKREDIPTSLTDKENEIECDGGVIILEFSDGTIVEVWNSEWGGIRLPEKESNP